MIIEERTNKEFRVYQAFSSFMGVLSMRSDFNTGIVRGSANRKEHKSAAA